MIRLGSTGAASSTVFGHGTTGYDRCMSQFNTDTSKQEAEKFTEPSAGPVPTDAEESAAERAKDDVDLDKVADHYDDMTEKGKNVEGEGDITSGV